VFSNSPEQEATVSGQSNALSGLNAGSRLVMAWLLASCLGCQPTATKPAKPAPIAGVEGASGADSAIAAKDSPSIAGGQGPKSSPEPADTDAPTVKPPNADARVPLDKEGATDEDPAESTDAGADTLTAAIESTVDVEEPAEPTEPFEPEPDTLEADVLLVPTDRLKRLHPEYNVWADGEGKRLVLAGEVCRQEGLLEMFACLKGTKEHEAVVNVFTKAFVVHAGLLALGAEPGHPVEFRPEYKAASGPEIEVTVLWKDEMGRQHEARGQDWVRSIKTREPLDSPWVFGGSGFWTNGNTGEQNYMAEDGDFICVSNFPSAMLDLPIESSQAAESLVYEVFSERVPPVGTKVTLILAPKLPAAHGDGAEGAATGGRAMPPANPPSDDSSAP
jgi:hypothetical protein